jgi:hypothetical protein
MSPVEIMSGGSGGINSDKQAKAGSTLSQLIEATIAEVCDAELDIAVGHLYDVLTADQFGRFISGSGNECP